MKASIHKRIILTAIITIVFSFSALCAFAGVQADVPENKSKLINLTNSAYRVSIANPEIAQFLLLSPRQIQLNGLKVGSTNMIVWLKGEKEPVFFNINVVRDDASLNDKLRELAPDDNISAYFVDKTVVLVGTARNEDTVRKAFELASAYAPDADFKLDVSEKDGVRITKTELKSRIINHIVIHQPNQILLQVKVAQVDKTSLKEIGVKLAKLGGNSGNFTGDITSNLTPSATLFQAFELGLKYVTGSFEIDAAIAALEEKGLAKILAEPNMLVRSGSKGEFRAVREIPFAVVESVSGVATTTIEYKEVGVKLNFVPELQETGLINLIINPAEVSSITGILAVNGYPIIDTKRVNTNVILKDGESLVIAGLLSEEAIESMSKVPILGDMPILGALFRMTSKEIQEKELVFFITPKLMKPTAAAVKTELPTDRRPTPEEEKALRWIPRP